MAVWSPNATRFFRYGAPQQELEDEGKRTDLCGKKDNLSEQKKERIAHYARKLRLYLIEIYNMTSSYGSSCANNGKGALNTPEKLEILPEIIPYRDLIRGSSCVYFYARTKTKAIHCRDIVGAPRRRRRARGPSVPPPTRANARANRYERRMLTQDERLTSPKDAIRAPRRAMTSAPLPQFASPAEGD
eukprot:9466924-Pyramimonas_sp.AAC.1